MSSSALHLINISSQPQNLFPNWSVASTVTGTTSTLHDLDHSICLIEPLETLQRVTFWPYNSYYIERNY